MLWLIAAMLSNVVEQLMIVHIMSSMDMVTFIMMFYLFSTAFMFAYHFWERKDYALINWQQVKTNKLLFVLYAGGAFAGNLFWFSAVLMIGVGTTAFILVFIKILTTGYSYMYMEDRFPFDKAISIALGIAALFVFSFGGEGVNITGVIFALLSCFGFATEVISRKKLVDHKVKPENAILLRTFTSSMLWVLIFTIGLGTGRQSLENITSLDMSTILLIILTAFIGGVIVHLFIFFGMKNVKVSQYNALDTMKPILLALGGVFFFDETITSAQVIAGAVIIVSTFYFLKQRKEQ